MLKIGNGYVRNEETIERKLYALYLKAKENFQELGVAFFTVREQLGLMPILIPLIANIIFFIVIYKTRNYFK